MIILRSTGPVISTRRSCKSPGAGATVHSAARTLAVSLRKVGPRAVVEAFLDRTPAVQQLVDSDTESAREILDEGDGVTGEDPLCAVHSRGNTLDAITSDATGIRRGGPGRHRCRRVLSLPFRTADLRDEIDAARVRRAHARGDRRVGGASRGAAGVRRRGTRRRVLDAESDDVSRAVRRLLGSAATGPGQQRHEDGARRSRHHGGRVRQYRPEGAGLHQERPT